MARSIEQKRKEIARLEKALTILKNEATKYSKGNLVKPYLCQRKAFKLEQQISLEKDLTFNTK